VTHARNGLGLIWKIEHRAPEKHESYDESAHVWIRCEISGKVNALLRYLVLTVLLNLLAVEAHLWAAGMDGGVRPMAARPPPIV
jgi:hypothetical protein